MLVGCKNTSINKDDFYEEIDDTHNKEELKENLTDLDYKQYKVDELGEVPIMMYHGVHNKKSSDTNYIGGNVDKDGYTRTAEAFRNDLEFYYQNGYRMIKLSDYINGKIDVEYGKINNKSNEFYQELKNKLEELSKNRKLKKVVLVLYLSYFEKLKQVKIAERLNSSQSQVSRILSIGKKLLKE